MQVLSMAEGVDHGMGCCFGVDEGAAVATAGSQDKHVVVDSGSWEDGKRD